MSYQAHQHAMYWGVAWALWGVGVVTTIGRAALRFQVQRIYLAEDYLAFICLIFLTAVTSLGTVLGPIFFDLMDYLHAAKIDPTNFSTYDYDNMTKEISTALKLLFCQMLLFWTTLWAAKFSILAFFGRIVIGLPRYIKIFWLVFALVLATYVTCLLTNFLTCSPLSATWTPNIDTCLMDVKRVDINLKVAVGADVGSDLLIMILPLYLLMKARISTKHKFGLACMFSLGLIIIAFAFVRYHEIKKVTDDKDMVELLHTPIRLAMWSQIEASIALLVTNIPAFRSLIATPRGISIRPAKKHRGRRSFPQSSSGTRPSEGLYPAGQKRTLNRRLSRSSFEMHSLHSESSSYENQEELGEGQAAPSSLALAIVRTTEVNVHSHTRDDEKYSSPHLYCLREAGGSGFIELIFINCDYSNGIMEWGEKWGGEKYGVPDIWIDTVLDDSHQHYIPITTH
ncbi:hypothetical protein ACJ72_02132 [Emergomyces africanus]|uniref:Rhodopsin domain-containing protein n=1 Tax=Emergomyces africanus TaxID=1955775 RepID=A0A1B7P3D3_9EURO|nr:hypothetical protein ACJ72_02132 [Emergomyces africanus]